MIVLVLRNKQKLPGNGVISSPTETVKKGKNKLKNMHIFEVTYIYSKMKMSQMFFLRLDTNAFLKSF